MRSTAGSLFITATPSGDSAGIGAIDRRSNWLPSGAWTTNVNGRSSREAGRHRIAISTTATVATEMTVTSTQGSAPPDSASWQRWTAAFFVTELNVERALERPE